MLEVIEELRAELLGGGRSDGKARQVRQET